MASIVERYGFHEWLCKTNFSFLIGASHPVDVIGRAADLGYASLCVNDFDGVYGLARCYRELQRLQKEGPGRSLELNYAAEIHLQADHAQPVLLQDTLVLVAKNWNGYKNLCRILSYAHREAKSGAYIAIDELPGMDVQDLFAIRPMRGVMRGGRSPQRLEALFEHFGGQLYFAVSRHFHPAEDQWIKPTLDLAHRLGTGCLLSQDAFFHQRSEKHMSDLLHAIRTNKVFDDCKQHLFANGERSLHSLDELQRFYGELPIYESAMVLSHELNAQCSFDLSQLHYHYPQEMIPERHTAQSYLEQLTWQGARQRFGEQLPEKIIHTLNNELELIRRLDFADYFLTVWDIVRWARAQDILCQGRGSAANSAVCYVLGITSVDPTVFDLLFERFISMERGDPPDIDVDFEHERREEVVQYIYRRFGRDRAAMVANVITFRNKGALRAVGKALGIEESVIGQMSGLCRSRFFRSKSLDVLVNELRSEHGQARIPWNLWIELTEKLQGFPHHLGLHSGGFMLSDRVLDYLLPREPATMPGRTVIQWSKDDIEALGFFKIDVLSLGMLTALRKCFHTIRDYYGHLLELHSIPADDGPTYRMIQRADTVGTFQIESRAQMSMLPRLLPHCFYDLVIEVAIIRPGPIQGKVIHPYLQRRHGLQAITFPDERLKPILERTLGVTIFQEQAMRIAIEVGDFTPGEANDLRRNIGAWNVREFTRDINPILDKLKRGMERNGIEQAFIDQLLGQMSGFSEYGFPESHAVSFALLAYASSYLKCHYPVPFYTALLNSQPMGFYSPHALLQSAQRDGIRVLPVCINHSDWDCMLERTSDDSEYAIRLGLRLVRGLSETGARTLIKTRADTGRWQSLEQFIESCAIYRDDFTALAAARAFDSFGIERAEAIWRAEAVPYRVAVEVEESRVHWKKESAMQTIQRDFQAFNTSLGDHPVQVILREQWQYPVSTNRLTKAEQLEHLADGRDVFVFGMVLVKQSPGSAKGMVFLTLEDETGFINLVYTPDVYERFYQLVERQSFLCVVGRVQKANNYHSILVKRVFEQRVVSTVVEIRQPMSRETDKVSSRRKAGGEVGELVKPRIYR